MTNTNNAGNAFDGATRQRYDNHGEEYRSFISYLKKNTATCTMAAVALNLYRPNACRYKRWAEQAGQLWQLNKGICGITGFPAYYLTANPTLRPIR